MDNSITLEAPKNTNDPNALPVELEASIAKHDARQLSIEVREGWGSTTGGKAIVTKYLGVLSDAVVLACAKPPMANSSESELLALVAKLDPDVAALCILQTALHGVALRKAQREMSIGIGAALSGELWAAGLTAHAAAGPKEARDMVTRIAKAVRSRHSSPAQRKAAARVMAAKAKYAFKVREWSVELKLRAGTWALNLLTETLGELFTWVDAEDGDGKQLTITEAAWDVVDKALRAVVVQNPVFFPLLAEPRPWTQWAGCGSHDPRVDWTVTFLRTRHKETAAAAKHAIKTGQMQPAVDAVNVLQGVPWRINTRMLEIVQRCYDEGLAVEGLPPIADMPVPARTKDAEWEAMDEGQRKLKRIKIDAIKRRNRAARSDRLLFSQDMRIAQQLAQAERFWTPMNCDWRGRVYALPHFNFQREDRVRALFQFANGEPITDDGYYWLKVHVANCGDFGKISKRPLKERAAWCDQNWSRLASTALEPFADLWWTEADKPFLFLAAVMELVEAIRVGPTYVCRMPVSFDGSCSGIQHLAAMTRAPEGSLVNLTPQELAQDVYATVAELVKERITADLQHEPENPADDDEVKRSKSIREMAALTLTFGVDRKLTKRNVMTYAYSSKKFGMAQQLQVDLMKPLEQAALEGKHEQHPFFPFNTGSEERPSPAARYIASHTYDAIETIIRLPGEAMKFLQKLAKALAHEGKPLRWTSPVGIPWINRYHDPITKRVELWLNDGGVRVRSRVSVAVGAEREINKDKAANGVAPNFVHANDAAHLLLVANAAAHEGIISIATVHDSFGCLPSRARRFNEIIREQFALMYETHDVLAEVLQQAKRDLTEANWDKLPPPLTYGNLNIKDILNADFAFA